MPRPSPIRRLLILVLAGLVVVAADGRTPAAAHTEVLRASPSPGEQVQAPVDRVELTFLDPVEDDVMIDVRRSSGDPVAGVEPVDVRADGRAASVAFPPITAAGDYVVEYRFTAIDGDRQRETYRFTVLADDGDGGSGIGSPAGAVALVVVVATGLVLALRRRKAPSS